MGKYRGSLSGISIDFDKPEFDDLEPDEKSTSELMMLILLEASGKKALTRKYSDREINLCARKLIEGGYLRGTIFDSNSCVWSRPSRKGRMVVEISENKY